MTKPEAIAELASLEEKERIAWALCNSKLDELDAFDKRKQGERDAFNQVWQGEYDNLLEKWSPLFNRKNQLKAFIAIA